MRGGEVGNPFRFTAFGEVKRGRFRGDENFKPQISQMTQIKSGIQGLTRLWVR
jgi:hypothetical protein